VIDLTGLPPLDLAIGLAFIFFLLATLAATIQEFIAAILGLRARTLEQGLRSMLEDPEAGWTLVDKFYEHELVRSLYRTPKPRAVRGAKDEVDQKVHAQLAPEPELQPAAEESATASGEPSEKERQRQLKKQAEREVASQRGKNAHTASRGWVKRGLAFFKRTWGPSYLSPRAFALVVLDNLAPDKDGKTIFDAGNTVLEQLPAAVRARVKPLLSGAEQDVETMRTNLEAWFDDTMARVSGWYKRKTQIILIVIGIALVPAINANTIKMGERMWKDDAVRAAVVAQAQAVASATPTPTPSGGATPTGTKQLSASARQLNTAAEDVDDVVKVGIPMGWRGEAVPRGRGEVAMAVGGWILTIIALSLGAPFWFDALSRLSRLRSSGKPETPLPAAGSGKPNERVLTPPQVPTVMLRHDDATPADDPPAGGSETEGGAASSAASQR
jgi:hypothetical protein